MKNIWIYFIVCALICEFVLNISFGLLTIIMCVILDTLQFALFLYRYLKSKKQSSRTILGSYLYALAGLVYIQMGAKPFTLKLFITLTMGLLFYHCLMLVILPFVTIRIKGKRNGIRSL